jgi:hypothetical protein
MRSTTPADGAHAALKGDAAALDSCRAMRTHDLRLRIQRADYVVDPAAVAEAMLRHALDARLAGATSASDGGTTASRQDAGHGGDAPDQPVTD